MEHNAQVFLALSISGALCFIAWRWARYRAARLREVTKHASSRDAEQKVTRLRRSCPNGEPAHRLVQ